MNESLARLIAVVVFIASVSISVYFRRKAERRGNPMRSSEGNTLVAVLRLIGLLLLLPFLGYIINPDWMPWTRFSAPDAVRWFATMVGLAAVPMILWLFSALGDNISPTQATRREHRLVTSGPYRWIRHPLYTTGFVLLLSLMLLTGVWTLGVLAVFLLCAMMLRTPSEEARLIETFGDDYRAYMRRTGRFLPRLG